MLNFNGTLVQEEKFGLSANNRAFKYGDSLFETVKIVNGRVVFWEDHYFRLMASMRMIRMDIPLDFTLEFLQSELLKTAHTLSDESSVRARLSVFRKDGGLYIPESNEVDYLIEVSPLKYQGPSVYRVDLYKDFYNYSGMLSTVKSSNKLLNVMAGVYAQENDLDNCILLNERKGVCETINGNIFLVKDNTVKTPALTEGCLKGIVRKKVVEILQKNTEYEIEEGAITPFEIQKADEVFVTNAIVGIQSVTHYRKKVFGNTLTKKLQQNLKVLEMTS